MPVFSRPTDAKSTPPSSRCATLSVYFCTNRVGTMYRDSVVQEPDTYTRPHSHPTKPLDHLIALWEFGEPVERNTPGGRYLAQRTGCAVVPRPSGGAPRTAGHGVRASVHFPSARPGHSCTASRRRLTRPQPSWRCRSRRSTWTDPDRSGSKQPPTNTNLASDRMSAAR